MFFKLITTFIDLRKSKIIKTETLIEGTKNMGTLQSSGRAFVLYK